MEDNKIHKFISKIKSKLLNSQKGYPSMEEYAFSTEEIADLNKQNKQKIQDLKQGFNSLENKNKLKDKVIVEEKVLVENNEEDDNKQDIGFVSKESEDAIILNDQIEDFDNNKNEELEENQVCVDSANLNLNIDVQERNISDGVADGEVVVKNSFINLSKEHQALVMENWNNINLNDIDKDIIEGKDLLNHNYTITYADSAAKYIHQIRKKYEIVICYLVGFNNEKKGIYNQTIFSSNISEEWKYLSNYIKVLESIRNFRK